MKINIIDEKKLEKGRYNGSTEKEIDIYEIGAISDLTRKIFMKKKVYKLTRKSFYKLKQELEKREKTRSLVLFGIRA